MIMKRVPIKINLSDYPEALHRYIENAPVYDSSCSPEARVIFIDRDGGYYLKSSPKGTLALEAELTRYYHKKGIAAEVVEYLSFDRDWLMTAKISGEDLTHKAYLDDPIWLCDSFAERLRWLHSLDFAGCPVPDRVGAYLKTVDDNYRTGNYDKTAFPDSFGYRSAEEAIAVVNEGRHLLRSDTLIHGDYCLPNIMFDNRKFTGFIDLGNGGVGDRHIDLFWGAWTLWFNLKTNKYRDRFFDAYGRDRVDTDMIRLVAACEVFG